MLAYKPNSRISHTPNFGKSYKPQRGCELNLIFGTVEAWVYLRIRGLQEGNCCRPCSPADKSADVAPNTLFTHLQPLKS